MGEVRNRLKGLEGAIRAVGVEELVQGMERVRGEVEGCLRSEEGRLRREVEAEKEREVGELRQLLSHTKSQLQAECTKLAKERDSLSKKLERLGALHEGVQD